jgi:2-succinyl-5-enolpyruvyl-6-hydroxy-3-cyclohexene-1-carboxylate synthase
MYTHIKQVQIIVSLLKQYNIRHLVISPGTRHVPLVHTVEIDEFFTCYSVVDERSAGYVALGMAESLDAPVCVVCTSATASCNYLPAMQEAYERHIPLIALTSDRARFQRFHGENQCINQVDMYRPYCKYAVDVPLVKNDEDYWYCNRCVNEALIYQNRNGKGPIQINFLEPLNIRELSTFSIPEIPKTRKIDVVEGEIDWRSYAQELRGKRVLVICGQYRTDVQSLKKSLKLFNEKFEAVVTTDYFTNVIDKEFVHTPPLDGILNYIEVRSLQPDIIISYGSKVYSGFGVCFRNRNITHWYIDEEATIYDPMRSLKKVFAVKPELFFEEISTIFDGCNSKNYYNLWKNRLEKVDFKIQKFTNYYVIKETLKQLPENSSVHSSVLNSMRFTNFSQIPDSTIVMGNICADGIDGALSTFLGQAQETKGIALLIIGDLSYLYDLNEALYKMPNNVRILLVNNNAGAEFHYNISIDRIPTLNRHIAASHHNQFCEISRMTDLSYRKVTNMEELRWALSTFFSPSSKPIMIEAITDADTDGRELRLMISKNTNKVSFAERVKDKLHRIIKKQ